MWHTLRVFREPGRTDLRLESGLQKPQICGPERQMKAKIMLGFLLVVLGTAFGVTRQFGGEPEPICVPGKPCQVGPKMLDGGPDPICRPGIPCPVGSD